MDMNNSVIDGKLVHTVTNNVSINHRLHKLCLIMYSISALSAFIFALLNNILGTSLTIIGLITSFVIMCFLTWALEKKIYITYYYPCHCGLCGKFIGIINKEDDEWGICDNCLSECKRGE